MPTAATVQAASLAPTHPALRWTPLDADEPLQHARAAADLTSCGIPGLLLLAETTVGYCGACFPTRAPRTT